MTIEARHIGELFAVMRGSYGHLWPHTSDDVPIWLRRLGGLTEQQIVAAADKAPSVYPNHPPSLGQFELLASAPKARPCTYLPPPQLPKHRGKANRTMLKVLLTAGGAKPYTLRTMQDLKNAIADDWPDTLERSHIYDLKKQLEGLIEDQDKAA